MDYKINNQRKWKRYIPSPGISSKFKRRKLKKIQVATQNDTFYPHPEIINYLPKRVEIFAIDKTCKQVWA